MSVKYPWTFKSLSQDEDEIMTLMKAPSSFCGYAFAYCINFWVCLLNGDLKPELTFRD